MKDARLPREVLDLVEDKMRDTGKHFDPF